MAGLPSLDPVLPELPVESPLGEDPPSSLEELSLDSSAEPSSDEDDESDPQAEKLIKHPNKTPKNPSLSKFFSVMA